jgi:hypothetical protein
MMNFTVSIDITIKLPSKLNHALIKDNQNLHCCETLKQYKTGFSVTRRGSNQSMS